VDQPAHFVQLALCERRTGFDFIRLEFAAKKTVVPERDRVLDVDLAG
jgi:hypothetical protein